MSKYYKAEDVINAIENKIAEYIPTLYGRYAEIPLELRMAIEHLPTTEVSEDCISREYLKSFEYINKGDFNSVETIREWIDNAPSVVPPEEDVGMERLDFVKKAIETHIDDALCGIFFTRNIVGDRMVHLDRQFGIDIEICYEYAYYEIFGLTDHEQKAIESFYYGLIAARRNK